MFRSVAMKFMLPIGVATFLFGILVLYRTYSTSEQSIVRLMHEQARLGTEYNLTIRKYVAQHLRPFAQKSTGPDEFIPELMSTSYVSRSISQDVSKEFPGYIIRFSSANPRNPANLASPEEMKIIDAFNADPKLREWSGEISLDGKQYLVHYRPRRMEKACLQCHSTPAQAPAALIKRYGDKAGFHLPLGKVVAMDTVAIPTESVQATLRSDVTKHFAMIFLWVAFIGIAVSLSFRHVVSHRLSAMVSHFEKMAKQPDTVRIEPVAVGGKDEIGTLARTFNVLVERLNTAYGSLDARVQERTAQLALANGAMERENVERKRAENKLREYADLLKYKNIELEAQKQQLLAQQEELKSINRELEIATAAATAANCAKSEFLANMSHEIRTPMTAVSGYTDLMLDMVCRCPACSNNTRCDVGQKGYEYLSSIRRNGDHLLQLIDDILDLSKVESGKLGIDRFPCSPLEILDEVQSLMQVRADSRKLIFTARTAGPVPETIVSDPRRIKQILLNLVGNAIKFTASGSVALTTRMSERPGAPGIEFAVTDTGIGISPDQIDRLFKPFSQLDTSAARQFGGSGLGLAISKRLAEMLGGSIGVESKPNKGSMFTVTIATGPIKDQRMIESHQYVRPASAPVATEVEHLPSDCRILLAEDGPDNQKLISFLLQRAGAQVEICENGQIAIEAALAAESRGEPFDVILMDMQMPVLDGYRATQLLRQQGYDRPIIALTAHAMTNDRERCLEVGCNKFATKPISRKRLIGLIADSLAQSSATVNA